MTLGNAPNSNRPKALRARRIALLASVAGLSAFVLLGAPGLYHSPPGDFAAPVAQAADASALPHPASFADIVAKVKPAVISVRVKIAGSAEPALMSQDDDQAIPLAPGSPLQKFFQQFGDQFGQNGEPQTQQTIIGEGSGFFISPDGYAVTNNHVVDHAKSVQVTTADGAIFQAKVVGTDPKTDLALIKVDGKSDFPYVQFANHEPKVGDWVIAVGNPFGLGGTVTAGIVSAESRNIDTSPYDDYIQIDAPINKGNSGGPAFDVEGKSFPYVKLAAAVPRVGDWVLAVGNPFGLGGTVTAGIVSARGRDIGAGPYDDFIQIDAPVNKGNSGGPTFDVDGNVIGVNTAIFSPSGGSVGIAFAIPADTVKSVIAQLRDKGSVTRGWIGVQIQPVTPEIADSMGLKQATGALVAEPQPDSPAAKAGIKSGDVITTVDGAPIHDARELARKIGTTAPGTSVKLQLIREGQDKTVTLTLGTLPNEKQASNEPKSHDVSESDLPKFGLTVAPATNVSGADSNGVVVTAVAVGGIAADHGFQVGDVILDVGGKPVSTPADVRNGLNDARKDGKHSVLFRVKSGENTKFVALPLGSA